MQKITQLERYKADLKKLLSTAELLKLAMDCECHPNNIVIYEKALAKDAKEKIDLKKILPNLQKDYQGWYSEAKALIRQLLPDRLDDFVRHYEKPKGRKNITNDNYRIEDYLQGLSVTGGYPKEVIVGFSAAIPHLTQQVAILKSAEAKFESSLFDIRSLVQADVFDSELDAARELIKNGFMRAAGAVSGVVLEAHLRELTEKKSIKIPRKNPGISDLSMALKDAGAIDIPQWRFIQHLADIRNLCDHKKSTDPTADQIRDLIDGVSKVIKTVL